MGQKAAGNIASSICVEGIFTHTCTQTRDYGLSCQKTEGATIGSIPNQKPLSVKGMKREKAKESIDGENYKSDM